jgi:hypothetical protein
MEQRHDDAPLERGPEGNDLGADDGAHTDPAGTVDALERKVLGAHPEDLRDVHDETEPNTTRTWTPRTWPAWRAGPHRRRNRPPDAARCDRPVRPHACYRTRRQRLTVTA